MKKAISTLLIATMLATSVPAWADPPTAPAPMVSTTASVTAPTPPPVISPLQKGQVAPYTGVLLSPPAVAQIVAQQDTAKAAAALALQHQAEIDAAQQKYALDSLTTTCTADKNILQAQLTDQQKQNQILTNQLKSATGGPGAPVWIGIGFAGGVVVTVLTAFAISKATH
jgi:hypothetical protein